MRFGMCNHKLRKGRYTLYLKFKKRDIPNTHISAEIYRIPDLKSPCIFYYYYYYYFFLLKKIRLYNIECWKKKKDVQKTDTILIIQRKNYTVSLHISTSTELVYNRLI